MKNKSNDKPAPAYELRQGHIRATVWRNQTDKGVFYNTVFERTYRDGEEWKTAQSFGKEDLLMLAWMMGQCFKFISDQE